MRKLYAALAVAGFLLPMFQFVRFVRTHGLDLNAFFGQAFANTVASMFALDLLASCVVFWVLVFTQGVRRPWLYVALTILVGLSFALPLFLYARETESPLPAIGERVARSAG